MATKVFLLRHGPYEPVEGLTGEAYNPDYQHFAGCPHYGPQRNNLDKARTFKTETAAKLTNEFKFWGYEVVEAEVTITLKQPV